MLEILLWLFLAKHTAQHGILYPKESETREIRSLDGLWNFIVSPFSNKKCDDIGTNEKWYQEDLSKCKKVEVYLMPVPSSYNDITQNAKIRDHVGTVWYDRTFYVPELWECKRVFLRFGSVFNSARVWINGILAMSHEIGHLPFQGEITKLVHFGNKNRVTVACDNRLSDTTILQGVVKHNETCPGKKCTPTYSFDFFNYAGIHRPVILYTTPKCYIDDITITTDVNGTLGIIHYNISYVTLNSLKCNVLLFDKLNNLVTKQSVNGNCGVLEIPNARLWWPYQMHPCPGYLYTLMVELRSTEGELIDIYRQPVGIRSLSWTNRSLLINGHCVYLFGFGRHEDADIKGRGLDLPQMIRDHNLIKWIGANSFKTFHYPYAEEVMDLADQSGIMVIDECPSVNTNFISNCLTENHKQSLTQLVKRDKNRPSVIMWSIGTDPESDSYTSVNYSTQVVNHVRSLDISRPITMSIIHLVQKDKIAQHLDIIGINRYYAWYMDTGRLDMITGNVIQEATAWHVKYNKLVFISEYGADTLAGMHTHPQSAWSEEYQVSMMSKHFRAFDALRKQTWFIGEFVWNFADFQTSQSCRRPGGNKKGIFTRNRQPKASAHHLRRRYILLAKLLYNTTIPNDLYEYLVGPLHMTMNHVEL